MPEINMICNGKRTHNFLVAYITPSCGKWCGIMSVDSFLKPPHSKDSLETWRNQTMAIKRFYGRLP